MRSTMASRAVQNLDPQLKGMYAFQRLCYGNTAPQSKLLVLLRNSCRLGAFRACQGTEGAQWHTRLVFVRVTIEVLSVTWDPNPLRRVGWLWDPSSLVKRVLFLVAMYAEGYVGKNSDPWQERQKLRAKPAEQRLPVQNQESLRRTGAQVRINRTYGLSELDPLPSEINTDIMLSISDTFAGVYLRIPKAALFP
ncbi:hypothetical protein ARMGADRAFT_553696 [Armillaria gallica]|uniref:Uncharacterized protein n=1 Tax=Armillaria gallica TaxID=47427 RepID=A0A2H3CRS2_ARMGA|nr:hypothetical protein ARMGADRAFT_553696 [Armillaria gallica]